MGLIMNIFSVSVLLVHIFLGFTVAQDFGEQCLAKFKNGRENFILDADVSVKEGATFIASPKVARYKDCIRSCCKETKCNVAFMLRGDEDGLVNSCFLFDCLYKNKYVCRFVKKEGYINYILDSVYESDLAAKTYTDEDDRPPVADGGPDRVIQPPDELTLNGIQSHDDHKIVSYEWKMVSGSHSVVMQKTQFEDEIRLSNFTSGVYKFQLTVTDASDQTDSTQVTVLALTPEQSEDHCMAPMKVGPCRGSFPRWHYNGASEKCEKFTFGGCRENLNNYLSLEECEAACTGSETNGKAGRGLPTSSRKGEKCGSSCTVGQFTCANGCCLDPGLECDGEKQCTDGSDEENCSELNDKFRILLQIPLDEQKVFCTEPPHTGSCRDRNTMWYYNPIHQQCVRFNYGGCNGNKNRFDTEDDCMKTCRGVTEKDVFAKESFERSTSGSETGVIVIAAILGLSILILLGVLAYCCMKGKKKPPEHQRVAVNGSQLHTTEDMQRLVYNSTTKPI